MLRKMIAIGAVSTALLAMPAIARDMDPAAGNNGVTGRGAGNYGTDGNGNSTYSGPTPKGKSAPVKPSKPSKGQRDPGGGDRADAGWGDGRSSNGLGYQ